LGHRCDLGGCDLLAAAIDFLMKPVTIQQAAQHERARWWNVLMPAAILFIAGTNFAWPEYGWARPVQIGHGVYLDNLLVILYAGLVIPHPQAQRFLGDSRANTIAGLVAVLALLGVISAGASPYRIYDVGQAGRLLVFSALVLLVSTWSKQFGSSFILRLFLLGIVVAGLANLYMSFTAPYLTIVSLPALRARNGAGGVIAMGIAIGALLFVLRRTWLDVVVAIAGAAVGVTAAGLSFSKTSMLIALLGIIGWALIVVGLLVRRRTRAVTVASLLAFGIGSSIVLESSDAGKLLGDVSEGVRLKFSGFNLADKYTGRDRLLYFYGVGEIVLEHPLTGVSYSGFFDAITKTDLYRSGDMAEEDVSVADAAVANPHNSFLYYAAANGIPGILVVVGLFSGFGIFLIRNAAGVGVPETLVALAVVGAYLLYGMTLPTLFNTGILYVPLSAVLTERVWSDLRSLTRERGKSVVHSRRRPALASVARV
jgi:O-antigen ligase